jgi:hypothetical protein
MGALTGRNCDDAGYVRLRLGGDLRELNYVQQSANFRGLEGQGGVRPVGTPQTACCRQQRSPIMCAPPSRVASNCAAQFRHGAPGGGLNWESE